MSDDRIERAIEGVLAVSDSNFPSVSDIEISATGRNSATITVSSYELREILAFAKEARLAKSACRMSLHTQMAVVHKSYFRRSADDGE